MPRLKYYAMRFFRIREARHSHVRCTSRALFALGIPDVADGNLVFYAEPTAADEIPTDFETSLSAIIPLLRVVTNNRRTSVGGGGTPRAPLAPRLDRASR
ncbi:MAG: hypothetical protein WBF93_00530 [Pirellulales bacterium]|nr:hypothetical protein [Pirellulales bacterium]